MELEKLARQLGAAIQQDKVYLDFEAARKANDADEELNARAWIHRLWQTKICRNLKKRARRSMK